MITHLITVTPTFPLCGTYMFVINLYKPVKLCTACTETTKLLMLAEMSGMTPAPFRVSDNAGSFAMTLNDNKSQDPEQVKM